MRFGKPAFVLFLYLLFQSAGLAQSDTLRVLFVGNSFTYFWNVPQVVQSMATSQEVAIITSQSTAGGATLEHHWNGDRNLKTIERIKEGIWDYVVLQNHSSSSIDNPEKFKEYGMKLGELARAHGAEPLYYMTWAYKSNPLMQNAITKGYKDLAKTMEAGYVPVGLMEKPLIEFPIGFQPLMPQVNPLIWCLCWHQTGNTLDNW